MKSISRNLLVVGTLSAALLAPLALAQGAPASGRGQRPCQRAAAVGQDQAMPATPRGRAQEHFRIADANKDGTLSRDEARSFPGFAARFDALDKNADGLVSSDELLAMQSAIREQGSRGQGQMGMHPGRGQGAGGTGGGRMGRGPMWQS